MTTDQAHAYPARLTIDYPSGGLARLSSALRLIYAIPIVIILALLTGSGSAYGSADAGLPLVCTAAGLLAVPVALMIVVRRTYPRWWFDFSLQLSRFETRVVSYLALMSDAYPSTEDEQTVHVALDYPDVERDLNRWLPLVKWLLAIPHYIVLIALGIAAIVAVIVAWFAILLTGRYPRPLFDFVEGVLRWGLRVEAYALLLITDRYPPFSLR